ncbi:serine esterase, putative [Plasmodium knowlesi strain H]|uniref:Serine esterase, putative n=3 Tax=Plasmodium knowlesi TaxID=5850 RepID=A0A5K1U3T7_PLAKH|nr:serine esterase, putative [Plasmodium knowlesi strain H]OTN65029.1 putative Serine esterase [Plasmodium knowlesi]CAA9988185.1 serine esterase, putative [Plasmodium knowlesi strain H]SBO20100.1 serine esterase, putative [Plasmodium knowlesi strain H]SBO20685.1 serine esterase, putative [Plasmodium knowlesi strain H]VVS77659.1 serine esterase, putative [Plasmodium knowlesi strain H]|eukprot:XP_002259162.1 serine esterase, putative [Plasmodium knowlesi strain H]
MKEQKRSYRSESIFSANRNLFEVLESIDDEKEARRSANFFNNNKNILLNLFVNPNSNNHVDSILLEKRNYLNHGTNAKKQECKKVADKEETSKGDAKTVRDNSPVCANKKWIEHFCWFCSLNLLDEVLEKEIYKEKIHPHVYDLIYDENTYFDTSSMMSVPYEFARFMLTQLDNNILHDIKINNIIKEEKYLFKKFCRKYKYNKKYRDVGDGSGSGRPSSRSSSSASRGTSVSSCSSDSVKSDHSLVYGSRAVSVRYSNYLNIRRDLFNSDKAGSGNGLDRISRVNRVDPMGGSSRNESKLFYDSSNLGTCDSSDLFYCKKVVLPDQMSNNNNSCDTLSLDSEEKSKKEIGGHSRFLAVGDRVNCRGGEQISSSVSNCSSGRIPVRDNEGSQKKKLSEPNLSSQNIWNNQMGRMGRMGRNDRNGLGLCSGSDLSVGRISPRERKEIRLTNRRDMRRRHFVKRDMRNNVHLKGDALCVPLLKRSHSFSVHRSEEEGVIPNVVINEGTLPQEARKDHLNTRSHRIYNKYKNNLNYIKQFYYIDETKKKPFPLCLYNIIKSYGSIKQCSRCYCFFNSISCHCLECKRKSNMSLKNPHYFIFQHGLTASVHDFQNIVNPLLVKYPNLFVYITYSNQSHTFEGVDVGTERICTELNCLFKIINERINVSMIGHSLGGILNRSVLINMYRKKMFKNKKLINFITFACPHIGVHENMKIMNLFSTYLGAHTIDDLNNKTTLLLKIASVESINILKKFENIIFYGNAQSDWLVGIRTSLILPYTLFNEELIMFIIEQAKNVPEIPINIFSVVHLYMRKKKLLFFYFYQDLKNPNYLLNKRKYQNRFLDQMLQTIISSRKFLSYSQRKKFNVFMNYYGDYVAKEDGKKGKMKRKKKAPYEDNTLGDNVRVGDVSSSKSQSGCSKREDSPMWEEQNSGNVPVQMNKRVGSIQKEDKAPVMQSRMDKPYMSDGVNVQMLPIRFRKNVSTAETNRRERMGLYESSDKLSSMNFLTIESKNVSTPQKSRKASFFKSHTYEDIHLQRNRKKESTSQVVSDTNTSENVIAHGDVNVKQKEESTERKEKQTSYHDKYLCIPENYKIVSNSTARESEGGMYSNQKINKHGSSGYVERVSAEDGKIPQGSRHMSDGSKSSRPAKESTTPIGPSSYNVNQSDTQENNQKKKLDDYKFFEKLFFDCLKRKIINDIKTLDDNLKKKKKKKMDMAQGKSFSLQNTINALKNYSLFYLKNGAERSALVGSAGESSVCEGNSVDGSELQNRCQNYQPMSEATLTVTPDQAITLGDATETVPNGKTSESCEEETKNQLNCPLSNESNKKKENNKSQLCEGKNEEYDYISEFFDTTSEDNEGGESNDESSGEENVGRGWNKNNTYNEQEEREQASSEQIHEEPRKEGNENPKNNIRMTSGRKKKWKGTTLLKGITKNDKKKYKQILFHIYSISNEQLIEKFCKNPELLYYEVLFYCLNQLPIQRYSISLPLYSNAHVQIIAHPRICSEESATVKHLLEHLIL